MDSKERIRERARAARARLDDREGRSHRAIERATALPEYERARTVMVYLDIPPELATRAFVARALASDKEVVIPYCSADAEGRKRLGLWQLADWRELDEGTWGILEPPRERWGEPGKEVAPERLDIALIPGVAFDERGGRIGNAGRYYDRLLARLPQHTLKVGLAFECQVFARLPLRGHDVYMDRVVTEERVIPGIR